jgi:hypothetical protein
MRDTLAQQGHDAAAHSELQPVLGYVQVDDSGGRDFGKLERHNQLLTACEVEEQRGGVLQQ